MADLCTQGADSCWGVLLMRPLAFVGVLALLGWTAQAEPVVLADEALEQAVAGKTVHLDTPFGVAIPITYQPNGRMFGKAGLLEYFLGASADRGRWWVAEGKLCQKWFKWLDAQPSCMRLTQDGRRLFWVRDDGLSGTATIAASLPPGAVTGPQGLGGPVDTPGQSVVATQSSAASKPANMLTPPSAVSPAPPLIVRAATVASSQAHVGQSSFGAAVQPISLFKNWTLAVTYGRLGGEQDYQWCHAAISTAAASRAAAPELILTARHHYVGGDVASKMRACLTAEPALQYVAKLALAAH
jgi:hypothetical protein